MTETLYTLDEVHAALAHGLVEDMLDHEDQLSRDEREPEVAPDPEFCDMAIVERNRLLDEYYNEEAAWWREQELRQQYPW
jgi:hypothetical protein